MRHPVCFPFVNTDILGGMYWWGLTGVGVFSDGWMSDVGHKQPIIAMSEL